MKYPVLIALLLSGAVIGPLTAENTKRRGVRVDPAGIGQNVVSVPTCDTIAAGDDAVTRSGFDKPLRSNYETFFLTNNLDTTVTAVHLTFNYTDRQGRQLNSVTRWIDCDIPAGATRQATIRSWDRQQSFRYVRSRRPSRGATGTPFDVSTTLDSVVIAR